MASVKELLANGADVNKECENTPLWIAAFYGFSAVVRCLLEHGANTEIIGGCDDETPLMIAAEGGHLAVVRCLVKYGADMNSAKENGNFTAIHYAALNGHSQMVEYLAEQGAEVDKETEDGLTALIFAVHYGYSEVAQCLLEHEAWVNHTGPFG